jgi:hypothetical protein
MGGDVRASVSVTARAARIRCLVLSALALTGGASASLAAPTAQTTNAAPLQQMLRGFDANVGQWPDEILFQGTVGTKTAAFTSTGLRLSIVKPTELIDGFPPRRSGAPDVVNVTFRFLGSRPDSRLEGVDPSSTRVNYFVGPEERWRTDVPSYGRIRYLSLYPGIDAAFYERDGELKYDFVVASGANPAAIILGVEGAEALRLSEEGDLVVTTRLGDIRQRKPYVYQERHGQRETVTAAYSIIGADHVAFILGAYDTARELVIDPEVNYSTYFGGNGSEQSSSRGLAIDSAGDLYLTGRTDSTAGTLMTGAAQQMFVARIDPDAPNPIVYRSYLSGSYGLNVVVDASGFAYALGAQINQAFMSQPYVAKLRPDGGMIYGRVIPEIGTAANGAVPSGDTVYIVGDRANMVRLDGAGNLIEQVALAGTSNVLASDSAGNLYVAGTLFNGALRAYVQKIGANPYQVVLGAGRATSGRGLAVDSAGHAYLAGEQIAEFGEAPWEDVFLARIGTSGVVEWKTFLAGNDWEEGNNVAVDTTDGVYVAGSTVSSDFPVKDSFTNGRCCAYLAKLSASTGETIWSTRFGGNSDDEEANGVVVDSNDNVWVKGEARSTSGLIGAGGIQPAYGGGFSDLFLLRIKQKESGGAIAILSSTTRWKAQKDTTAPVVVNFTGPNDLTAATLELTDPNGALVANPTLAFEMVAGTDPPQYKITWSGPWTTTAGGASAPLQRGNYKVVVKGTRQNGSISTSAAYEKVSLVEVGKIEIRAASGGAPLDGNPGTGGGARIFAEAQEAPTVANPSPVALDQVTVIATIEPPIPDPGAQGPVAVRFRSFDVDDPSANGRPVDDESRPCTPTGCDNLGIVQSGYLSNGGTWTDGSIGVEVTTSGSDATASFQTSIRQGDNYRIAASTSADWLNGLVPVTSNQVGLVTHLSGEVLTNGVQLTEMLTVWRTLHVEVDALVSQDSQADQAQLDLSGNFSMLQRTKLIDNSGPFFTAEHPRADGWDGANLTLGFHPADRYDVTGNQRPFVDARIAAGQPDLTNGLRPPQLMALSDKSYVLRDDEITSLESAADYSLSETLFASAYVKLSAYAQTPQDAAIPFSVGLHRNIVDNLRWAAQLRTAKTYWSVQLLSAFDGIATADFDPRSEGVVNLGVTTIGRTIDQSFKLKSSVFLETIRDLYEKAPPFIRASANRPPVPLVLSPDINKRVTAHELLHTFSLVHDAAIMCGAINVQNNTVGGTITPDHVKQLRSVEEPTPAANNNPCP